MGKEIYSFMFFNVFCIYTLFGIYIILLNKKSMLNRTFLGICISMAIWSYTFTIIGVIDDYDSALTVKRIGSLGWGTMYSFLLHFALVLTGRKDFLKKKISYVFIYAPAFFNVYVFGLSPKAYDQYGLVWMDGSWVSGNLGSAWDTYFNIYYILYTSISIWTILVWGKNSEERFKKVSSRVIAFTFMSAFILGSITDVLMPNFYSKASLKLGPAIVMIPIAAILFIIKKYGFMNRLKLSRISEEGIILSQDKRRKFYYYIGSAFVIGSLVNWGHVFFFSGDIVSVTFFSTFIFINGAILFFVPDMSIGENCKDNIMIGVVAVSIPVITLRFLKDYASNIVWPVPLIFLIISAIFNKKKMLWVVGISTVITQLTAFIIAPNIDITVGPADHFSRALISGIGIMITYYVNRVYIQRLEENERQKNIHKVVSEISKDFVTVSVDNLESKVLNMFSMIGEYFSIDRAYIFLFSENRESLHCLNEWSRYGLKYRSKKEQTNVDAKIMCFQDAGTRIFPISGNGTELGFLGVESQFDNLVLNDSQERMFNILANLSGDAIVKLESEKEIKYMAYYDSLTELPNRSFFKKHLKEAISMASDSKRSIGVMLLDLDSFKYINDTVGHEGGDTLLKYISRKLREIVRSSDMVARLGGDEFIIVLSEIESIEQLKQIADEIVEGINRPVEIEDQEFFITTSAGIALYPEDGDTPEELMKSSDLAMYESKSLGKNRWTLYNSSIKEGMNEAIELKNSLYRAIERDELLLHYQPQVCLKTGSIVGLEALVRWNHPQKGIISPGVFIPLAEESDFINSIGEWVIKEACRQNKAWQDSGYSPVRMAVNLSMKQVYNQNLFKLIEDTLDNTGMDSKYLELEVTESVASEKTDYLSKALEKLKSLGLSISIDDFGTDYSSFSRFKDMPIDRIKIDRQFIQGICRCEKDEAIIKVMVYLTKMLGLSVIAEGVETEAQLDFIKKALCDEVQGYYYYKPMKNNEITQLLKEGISCEKI